MIQHDAHLIDGAKSLGASLEPEGTAKLYHRCHRILAQGGFVLAMCEGHQQGRHRAFYELFRVANGYIAEHWNTAETVPPRDAWKNDNGKF